MYLIKKLVTAQNLEAVFIAKDGIPVWVSEEPKRLREHTYNFWGTTEISLGEKVDFSKFPKSDRRNEVLLTYVNTYKSKNIGDGNRELDFYVDEYQPDQIEGYIIFMNTLGSIETTGEKIGGRYCYEIVVVLREGDYITVDIDDEINVARVIDGKLVLATKKKS